MKNKNIIILCSLFLVLGLSSCSEKEGLSKATGGEGLPVYATIDTRSLSSGLECELFIYHRANSGDNYTFKEKLDLTADNLPYELQFTNDEVNKQYRFLFVAQPTNAKKMVISTNGNNWTDLRIETTDQYLTPDYYYGILDKTGAAIVADGNIHGELTRLVGQITLDIFRINGYETEPLEPMDIVSDSVASVLDRVHTIQIEYKGLTKSIRFDDLTNIVEVDSWDDPYTQTIQPDLNDRIRVVLPQAEKGLVSGQYKGSVRIKGVSGFTSSDKVRAKYVFTYYDTTPINEIFFHFHDKNCYGEDTETICGFTFNEEHTHFRTCYNPDGSLKCKKTEHIHTSACYDVDPPLCNYPEHDHNAGCFDDKQQLTLNLPQISGYEKLLEIIPNTYTVNRAGIHMDRIIDLDQPASFEFETIWENEQ